MRIFVVSVLLVASFPAQVWAQECDTHSRLPVPRFVSLIADQVYGRSGPSRSHAIRWEYLREGLPVEVIAETEDWRQVRDPDGEETWIHRSMLSGERFVAGERTIEVVVAVRAGECARGRERAQRTDPEK